MGKTELIVRRFVVSYTKLVAGWFVGAHTMEKPQQAALVFPTNGGHKEYKMSLIGWLVGFGFNGPLRQYFSLYRAVSEREGERGKKG